MRVYHGTILTSAMDIYNNGINIKKSKRYLDFGIGFYTTSDYELAKNMAIKVCMRESIRNPQKNIFPSVVTFEFREDSLLNVKKYEQNNIEWARFVLFNRLDKSCIYELGLSEYFNNEYDIIIGGISDGNIAQIAADLRFRRLDLMDYIFKVQDFLKYDGTSYGTQIVFKNEKSLSCIECIKYDTILYRK